MNTEKFLLAHEAFLTYMKSRAPNNEPFNSFEHPFLYSDEIEYKRIVHANAMRVLQFSKWQAWQTDIGRILEAVRTACSPQISANLLEHRFGINGSYKALYRVEKEGSIASLERALHGFFLGGDTSRDKFGPRFDTFAEFLRSNSLGCNWAFMAYLSFLADHRRYFPILPTQFDALLDFYEIPIKVAGHVSWQRYSALLELADDLRERLSIYGPTDTIGIQSYMWVVSGLVKTGQVGTENTSKAVDFDEELARRIKSAQENERIGLKGEIHVLNLEREKLANAGSGNLAKNVRLVSPEAGLGYDILSFDPQGREIHIEVKTTTRTRETDLGFWLSENERSVALGDTKWCICRVWDIDVNPQIEFLGNIVQSANEGWEIRPSTWRVIRKLAT